MDRYIGRILDGRYEILEVIGTGGMAVVYKARCHRLNRMVAIKILRDENLQDDDFRRRFHAEGQAVGMLSHPNIVSVYDVSSVDGVDYIVMELVEGITLKQYMEKKGVLNWKETLHFAIQIAKALDHAHSRGLVHRDIKPHNVMVMKNGSVRVTDFGIARIMSKSNTLTKEALGSVHYISPEQAKGGRVDNRSDLYSLGVVMYEMITGRPPYDGESPVSVAIQHIAGGARKPSEFNPNIPAGLEQIILKAMAHDLKDRYATALDMTADMDELRKDPEKVFPLQLVKSGTGKAKAAPAQKTKQEPVTEAEQKKPERVKKEKTYEQTAISRGKVATVAVVSCCLVITVAVVIFLILLGNGTFSKKEANTYEVPKLVGMHFDNVPEYEGIQIVQQGSIYSDDVPVGCIISQLPEDGTIVEEGRTIYVVVSLGPKPANQTMPKVEGMERVEALSLLGSLNLNLDVTVDEEYHDTVEAGYVISSSVAEGEVLHKGHRITLKVSLGKEIITATMPDLVRNGTISKSTAEAMLSARGLTNVVWVPIESFLDKGMVISQNVEAGADIDITTEIIVEYSSGVKPIVTMEYTIKNLPVMDADYVVTLVQDGKTLGDYVVKVGSSSLTVFLTGRDKATLDIYINYTHHETITVEFVEQ